MKTKSEILVTGGAGFIGSHLVERLLGYNYNVTIVDNFDLFYPKEIKLKNISGFINNSNLKFIELDILDNENLNKLPGNYNTIIHLAAKAGVRPSIEQPILYQDVNVKGTQNLLEFAKNRKIKEFIFASSSSVYGINKNYPWKEEDSNLYPISPYASTKLSGELLGHVYSHLYDIKFIGLRFFTVYGPRQRPDLAIHSFTNKILNNEIIKFFGDGTTKRDYTYVSDIVDGIICALNYDKSKYEIFNLGNNYTVSLSDMIKILEDTFNKKAILEVLPEQNGDVPITYSDINKAKILLNYSPKISFSDGINYFKDWILKK